MDLPNWLVWIGVGALCLFVLGGLLALVSYVPNPENRPAPPERTADLEETRDAALRKIAARSRRQDERDASARISRGW